MSDANLKNALEIMTSRIGEQTSQSEWFEITQGRINEFCRSHHGSPMDSCGCGEGKSRTFWRTYSAWSLDLVHYGASTQSSSGGR